jgi:hypothetical protein
MLDWGDWPTCLRQRDNCQQLVHPERWRLGYHWCPACADGKHYFPSIQMHKSNAVLITSKEQARYTGSKTPRD